MNPSIRRLLVLTLASFVALAVAGCAKKSLAPTAPRATAFEQSGSGTLLAPAMDWLRPAQGGWANYFPLDSGGVWTYAREFRVATVSGSDSETSVYDFHSTIESRMLGPRVLGGVNYVLERDVETGDGGPYVTSIFSRQDSHGLYEADVPISGAVARSPTARVRALAARAIQPLDRVRATAIRRAWERAFAANAAKLAAIERALSWSGATLPALSDTGQTPPDPGMPPGDDDPPPPPPPGQPPGDDRPPAEIQRLAYPLHPGQHWAIRDEPGLRLFANVEAPDVVRVRSERLHAWRIRLDWPDFFGPHDRLHVWYGPHGFLGLELHVEELAIDESGNVVGKTISEETRTLTDLSLVGAHRGLAFDPDR